MGAVRNQVVRNREIKGRSVRNLVLRGIPDGEFALLERHLEYVSLEGAAILEREGERIDHMFFINTGIVLMIVETIEGKSVEVGLIGRGSVVGLQAAAGMDDFTHGVTMLIPGDGFRVAASTLKELLPAMPKISRMLVRRLAIRAVMTPHAALGYVLVLSSGPQRTVRSECAPRDPNSTANAERVRGATALRLGRLRHGNRSEETRST
jgi:hypothetical protein